ncbi:unnamed protein product [Rotaria sp. Silwood2]|nr:unnamed protein product [Rotaria sp. Silwood2]CAF4412400.1 unnamed protein product [Rotaria sp. Silwood2]
MKWFLFIGYVIVLNKILGILGCTKPSFENLIVQSDFNLYKFLGIWYEIKWLPDQPHNEFEIWRNTYLVFQLENSSTQTIVAPGRGRLINTNCFSFGPWVIIANNNAKMILQAVDINDTKPLNRPFYILKTDYEHYALIYSCTSENYIHTNPCEKPRLWVFSRTTSLSNDYLIELDNYIVNNLCINLTELEITPHDGESCYSSSSSNICVINIIFFIFLFLIYI